MRYVLSGVETNNKGAELMLYAILQEIENRDKDAIVYVTNVPQGLNYIHSPLNLKQKPIWKVKKAIGKLRLGRLVNYLGLNRLLSDVYSVGKIDYFLDASGFNVSDKWNVSDEEVREWDGLLSVSKRDGGKIVFLPQGFGPIKLENTKKLMSLYDKYGDLIIAREEVSYNYIKQSGLVDMAKVKIYSDFTSLVKGIVPDTYSSLEGSVCIIPNVRMIDKGGVYSKDFYLDYLVKIINEIRNKGEQVFILNHEGKADEKLAYELSNRIDNSVPVVSGLNGLEVKGLISISKLVITSRFHGVASSLNSCVPCLCTSWSHKYSELYKDYGLESGVLPLDDIVSSINTVNKYLDKSINNGIREHLYKVIPNIQEETKNMWEEIWIL